MKSRISFYNKGFAKSLLRRFWPLWVLWLAVLLYAPLQLAGIKSIDYFRELDYINNVNRSLLETGTELAKFSIFAMPVMAMAMLSYLYDRRSCGLVNSLPMKREEAYRRKMEELRTSARNDFLANMSHDIRTPMNAIVGYTNIAKSNPEDAAAVRDALDKISSSSHFLLSLINDILDISKIESGKMQLSHNPCNLLEVFRRIEDITLLQAKNKSLNIRYDHSSVKHTLVNTDELRLEQILINIISNAIKYTPEGKDVELIVGEEEMPGTGKNRYRFIIRDTGVGISEEYLPHIFESFTREENTKLNRVQGTGLGLAITAKVVEMMGGTISVKSKVGEGSEFTVVLEMDELQERREEADRAPVEADLSGRRVLLVEDNEINAEIAVMILSQYGLLTERAKDGQEGFEKVRTSGEGYYDAVLMDIQMPVMNGYEASSAIRAMEGSYFKHVPIIAMSANAYDEDVRDSLRSGMNAHIAKPYQPEDLMAMLGRYIKA